MSSGNELHELTAGLVNSCGKYSKAWNQIHNLLLILGRLLGIYRPSIPSQS